MLRKQGVVQGIMFSLGVMIIIASVFIVFGKSLQAFTSIIVSLSLIAVIALLGWITLEKAF